MNRSDNKKGSADLKYGFIGYPVSHSMSPSIFGAVFFGDRYQGKVWKRR